VSLAAWLLRKTFVRFALVGAAGYVVDTAVLAAGTNGLGLDPYSGRVLSIFVAMTCTWAGNRYLTFARRRAHGPDGMAREWMRFVGANAVGALVNYGLYAALVHSASPPLNDKYAALFLGVLAGMLFNFTLSHFLVFRGPPGPLPPHS
jgi:putative flippase GtrA